MRPFRRLLSRRTAGLGLVRLRVSSVPQCRIPARLQGPPRRVGEGQQDEGVFRRHFALYIGPMDPISHVSFPSQRCNTIVYSMGHAG